MGQFSWKTGDTEESIYSSEGHQQRVFMLKPDGSHLVEDTYEGYGVFGGVDAYDLLWDMNKDHLPGNLLADLAPKSKEDKRNSGIALFFDYKGLIEFPLKFSFRENATYENTPPATSCPDQGWFCEEEEEEEEDY